MKSLEQIIIENADKLEVSKLTFEIDSVALLKAIAMRESTYSSNNKPRFEAAFFKGGYYYKHSENLQNKVNLYGQLASCSYSSFQIMYITANELGFNGKPNELNNDEIAIEYVIKLINKRIINKNPKDIRDIFDAYNSGNFKDKNIPFDYIKYCLNWYNRFISKEKYYAK